MSKGSRLREVRRLKNAMNDYVNLEIEGIGTVQLPKTVLYTYIEKGTRAAMAELPHADELTDDDVTFHKGMFALASYNMVMENANGLSDGFDTILEMFKKFTPCEEYMENLNMVTNIVENEARKSGQVPWGETPEGQAWMRR